MILSSDVGEIDIVDVEDIGKGSRILLLRTDAFGQKLEDLRKIPETDHVKPFHDPPLPEIGRRDEKRANPQLPGFYRDGKDPGHGGKAAGEAQLPDGHDILKRLRRDHAGGRQNAERDGKIEAAAALGHVRRGQVDRDPLRRERDVHVPESRPHTVLRFPDLARDEPDHAKLRETVANVRLHADRKNFQAADRR